jgi:hypothetical protein
MKMFTIATLLLAAILAGCSEKTPRVHRDARHDYNGMSAQGAESPMRERTLNQGAAGRM